jgi:hypothetical protein
MTTRYKTLLEFRSAKLQARQERDVHEQSIKERWMLLKEPQTRRILLRDAMGDMLRSWKPYRRMHELLDGRISGSTVSAVGIGIASMQGGFVKRMVWSGISMLLGKVIGDTDENEKGPGLLSTLATAIGSMRNRMRERKAQREEEEVEAEASSRD